MNRTLISVAQRWRVLQLAAALIFLSASTLSAQVGLLVFIDQAPSDASVDCFGDVSAPRSLRATIVLEGSLIDTIAIFSFDSLSVPDAPCTGGSVFRIWRRMGNVNTIEQIQETSFGPAPAGSGPGFQTELLPPRRETIDCRDIFNDNVANNYDRWLSDRRLGVAAGLTTNCAPLLSLTDDAPDTLIDFSCNDSVRVTFVATDVCGQTASVDFRYVSVDTSGPVISGVLSGVFDLSCTDEVPATPAVSVSDCDTSVMLTFTETSTRIMDGSCRQYEFDLIRTWAAADNCGNSTVIEQRYQVRDTEVPDFRRPNNANLDCTEDPNDLGRTGLPTNFSDNCTPADSLNVEFTDEVIAVGACPNSFNVLRTWTVTDLCNNSRVRVQTIRVRDDFAPTFRPPAAQVNVSCANYEDTSITGEPDDLNDQCDPSVQLQFDDIITPGNCPGNFTVAREWRIFDDCGNTERFTQMLTVTDTTGPVVITAPTDLVTSCNSNQAQNFDFNVWLADLGGARFFDDCTQADSLTITVVKSGTDSFPLLPPIRCTEADGTVRRISVDIRVADQCGNAITTTMEYRQLDEQPINIFDCSESQVLGTDANSCEATVALLPPTFQDQCSSGNPFLLDLRDTALITSAASNPAEFGSVPVDPLVFNIPINHLLPVNGFNTGDFTITLENVDAEGEDEFFFIFAEDGTLLGTTARGNAQCETVITTGTISPFDFTRYANDGVVTFRLEPNIPAGQPGTFAINNLCDGGSRATIRLTQSAYRLTEIAYEVNIDDRGFERVDPIDTVLANLGIGLHQITYRATDCGGSVDECSYTITVEDLEPPVITCPDDIVIRLDPDSCQITFEVPLPPQVEDNCEPYSLTSETVPTDGELLLFPFGFDPNLNSFQARTVFVSLTDIPGNLTDSVDINVHLVGTFNNERALLDVLLPDGSLLGTSRRGDATCSVEGVLRLRIAAADFLAQVNGSGSMRLELRPRPVTVPPGQQGDGVIPCDDNNVEEGGNDGISGAYVEVVYRSLFPTYFTTGATTTQTTVTSTVAPDVRLTLNQGVTEVSYIVSDPGGNIDTCSFEIAVRDVTPPVAVCTPTTIFVDPSGLEPTTIIPTDIGGGSDNCGLDTVIVSPNVFSCDQYGESVEATLVVLDTGGNRDSCTTILSIAPLAPTPTASTSVCGGDTLRLNANPPTVAQPGQTIYTYQWFDPGGALISTQQNPVLPGVDESREGAYRVVIRGLTGCEAEGVVNIDIGGEPAGPIIEAPQRVCLGDNVVLTSLANYAGQVRYEWFRGQPGANTPLGESTVANFSAPFETGAAEGTFFAIAYVNGCASPPSNQVAVGSTSRPTVRLDEDAVTVCELSDVTLSARGLNTLGYEWSGPNDFMSADRTVNLAGIATEQGGDYSVRTIRGGGCFSEPATVSLTVLSASEPTSIQPVSSFCPTETLELFAEATDGDRYLFDGPGELKFETTEPFLRLVPISPDMAGEWTVRVQRGVCPSAPSDPVVVVLGVGPTARASTIPDPVCSGNDLILQGSSNIAGSSYSWTGPNGFSSAGIAPILEDVNPSLNGDFVLTVTAPSGCSTKDTIAVRVLPGITIESISISSGNCLSGGEPVSLFSSVRPAQPGDGSYVYRWVGPEGSSTNDTLRIPNVSLASNGVYTLTVENSGGCVSPVFSREVEFDFAPARPVTPFTPSGVTGICSGDTLELFTNDFGAGSTYLWRLPDGTNIPSTTNRLLLVDLDDDLSGSYTVRIVRDGCTSLPSEGRMITVTPFPAITVIANDPACTGQAINFQATDVAGAIYTWRGPNNFSSSLPDPSILSADPAVHAGTYSVVASRNGCTSDTMLVEMSVLPTPNVPVIQPIPQVCTSDSDAALSLSVNPNTVTEGATYSWFIQNGQVPVGQPTTEDTLLITDFGLFAGGGSFDFQVSANVNGCSSELSAPMTIRLDEFGGAVPDAGRDTSICAGIFLLEAAPGGAGTGRWSLVGGTGDITIVNPDSRNTAVQGLTQFGGPYQFAWTLSSGSCINFAADTVTLFVTDGEEADAGTNILACSREGIRLDATPAVMNGSGGRWTQALAQELLGVEIVDPSDPNTMLNGLQADNIYSFMWTVTSNCGIKTDNVVVNISDPTPFAGQDDVSCNQERSAILLADETTIGSVGRWRSIDDDVVIDDADSPTTMVENLMDGNNLFIWEVDGGACGIRSRDTVVVNYSAAPAPRDDDYEVEFQGSITFTPGENDVNPLEASITYGAIPAGGNLRDNGDGSFTFTVPPNFVGELALEYNVSTAGCAVATATSFFQIGQGAECLPPNIFTPNGDNMNDFFVVPCLLDTDRFPNSSVTIYNQWGDEVYRSGTPYRSDWDGTFQGNTLPVATYFYIIDFDGRRDSASGSVRIER